MTRITVRGEVDDRAVQQLRRCATAGDAPIAALLPDGHVGYSQPIGGAIGYRDYLSPSGVGYDIGCGNKAVLTSLTYEEIASDLPGIADEIFRRVSFGVGRVNDEPVDHPVFESIEYWSKLLPYLKDLLPKAEKQLGTVGSGNHYVDLFRDEQDRVWIGVHFGSRGFGHAIASGFLAMAQGKEFGERAKEGEMDAPPTLLHVDSALGQDYQAAMGVAGEFAYAGRDVVCDKVLEILGAESRDEVHNHHNFAWREAHQGESLWVVRKGCTPAFPGQRGFVGATMGEPSVILHGRNPWIEYGSHGFDDVTLDPDVHGAQESLLYSTIHGAGRVMSRTQAAGKTKWIRGEDGRKRPTRIGKGLIDWDATRADLRESRIELRGGGADEAPGAYKRLDQVLDYVSDTVEVLHTLTPIVVCMAGADVHDPWKD